MIIGGTACDMVIADAGFIPRVTKDIDIILVVEALSHEFVEQFWKFVQDGEYERKEKSKKERKYYRFMKPANKAFPFQIELFARNPDLLDLKDDSHLTPIPTDDDLSSLSAILLNDSYYRYMLEHSVLIDGLHRANLEVLILGPFRNKGSAGKRQQGGQQTPEEAQRRCFPPGNNAQGKRCI